MGGEDFDNQILNHVKAEIEKQMGMDVSKNPKLLRRLRTKCEAAKRGLSATTSVVLDLDLGDDDFSI